MRKVALLAVFLGIAGCNTKYQDIGFTGGVDAQPITNETYRIVARGNAYTSATTIQDYALLKAAETAISVGKTHFVIVSGNDATRSEIGRTPGTISTFVSGNTAFSTYNPGVTYNVIKPGQDVYIRVFTPKLGEASPAGAFKADEIIVNIGSRVKRPS